MVDTHIEDELDKLSNELMEHIRATKAKIAMLNAELNVTKTELATLKNGLKATKAELAVVKKDLQDHVDSAYAYALQTLMLRYIAVGLTFGLFLRVNNGPRQSKL